MAPPPSPPCVDAGAGQPPPALSVGDVVVDLGAVVVVVVVVLPVPAPEEPVADVVVVVPLPFVDEEVFVVVVVVAGAGGATNGTVSPRSVVSLVEGPAVRLVHARRRSSSGLPRRRAHR